MGTPKLLPKHQRREEDRRSKSHQDMSLVEYGYEPIGRPNPVFSQKPKEEDASVPSDEKLTETDTILHLSRHNDGNLKTTASETKQGKTLLNNLIDKVKKLSKEESHALIKRKDSKEVETVTSKIDDNDHPAVSSKLEEEQEEERRKKEIQETEKRAQKEAEKQLKEEEKTQKKEQERAKEQEKRRLKEEAKILKKEQGAEQLRLRKMKEEQEKVVKKEKEDQLKQQKIKAEEERQQKEQEES